MERSQAQSGRGTCKAGTRRYGARAVLAMGVMGVVFSASLATASTWTVALDGSGQMTSIQETIDLAQDGDTILIQAGHYVEDVTVHSKARLNIAGEGSNKVFIAGLNRVGTLHIGKWPYGATEVHISGMTIQQHGGLGVGIFNGKGITLKDLRVNGQVFGQQVRDVRIENCVVGGSETTGLAFADSHVRLVGNIIRDNDHGVSVGGTSTVHMERNVIMRNLFEGVLVADSGQATLLKNTLVENGKGVTFRDKATGRVEGNIIAGSGVGITWSAQQTVTIAHNGLHDNGVHYQVDGQPAISAVALEAFAGVHASPQFVAPESGDYRLKASSPLLRVGRFAYLGALAPATE